MWNTNHPFEQCDKYKYTVSVSLTDEQHTSKKLCHVSMSDNQVYGNVNNISVISLWSVIQTLNLLSRINHMV